MEQDTISGGEFIVTSSALVDSLIQKNVNITCYKPEPKETPTVGDPCANNPKVMGYKIQLMYSKNRNNARDAMNEFNANFAGFTPEMAYNPPDYKVLVGEYFTKRSAAMDLARIKKKFPSAFLVAWRVWCRKAK